MVFPRRFSQPDLTLLDASVDGRPRNVTASGTQWTSKSTSSRPVSTPSGPSSPSRPPAKEKKCAIRITTASPEWHPLFLAPEPITPITHTEYDADAAVRKLVNAAADATASSYSYPLADALPVEMSFDPLWLDYEEEPCPLTDHDICGSREAPQQFVDPSKIIVDTFAPVVKPGTKKRKLGDSAHEDARKTRKARGARSSGSGRDNKSEPTGGSAEHNTPDDGVRPIPTIASSRELHELLGRSQVWAICPTSVGQLPPTSGILYYARSIRPVSGGKNGLVLQSKRDVESLTFAQCHCGRTQAKSSTNRHVTSTPNHYPRIREHALPKVDFKWYRCDTCDFSNERKDIFDDRHCFKACSRRNEPAERFCHRLEDPNTCAKILELVRPLRDEYVERDVQRLNQEAITDQLVAEVMDSWDVLPDPICAVLRRTQRYHCFTEADVKARDEAIDFITNKS
ncbi:unnamed protein product [Peniophora sp. CBMAI 1063]|nr:unnamed protein product [Peniophora sp. CBMAI 1063]